MATKAVDHYKFLGISLPNEANCYSIHRAIHHTKLRILRKFHTDDTTAFEIAFENGGACQPLRRLLLARNALYNRKGRIDYLERWSTSSFRRGEHEIETGALGRKERLDLADFHRDDDKIAARHAYEQVKAGRLDAQNEAKADKAKAKPAQASKPDFNFSSEVDRVQGKSLSPPSLPSALTGGADNVTGEPHPPTTKSATLAKASTTTTKSAKLPKVPTKRPLGGKSSTKRSSAATTHDPTASVGGTFTPQSDITTPPTTPSEQDAGKIPTATDSKAKGKVTKRKRDDSIDASEPPPKEQKVEGASKANGSGAKYASSYSAEEAGEAFYTAQLALLNKKMDECVLM
ncbi:hypothetical protein EJ08DRAFT_733902 [Tothia fuscella]|uniref:Uncharacterized protein n=1 Tax=Tothia fuscella TaxID=1048955 RepID=A0A9P4TXR6_9PEZI|nr:hypothetical protein EJ08DRAFT_733902 [Tothia fuscella]